MSQEKVIFDLNEEPGNSLKDNVNIQVSSEVIQINYYQLLKWSMLVREMYPKIHIARLSEDLRQYQHKYNIKTENIKSFFQYLSDERVQVNLDQYFDHQKLSVIFGVPEFRQILKKYSENHCGDINYIIRLIKEHLISSDMDDLIGEITPDMEAILSNNLIQCLQYKEFGDLPVPHIYRIIENSHQEVPNDILFNFIKEFPDDRYVLLTFVNLKQLSDQNFFELCDKLLNSQDPLCKEYIQYLGVEIQYLRELRSEKIKLQHMIKLKMKENEEIKQENVDLSSLTQQLKAENEQFKNDKIQLQKELDQLNNNQKQKQQPDEDKVKIEKLSKENEQLNKDINELQKSNQSLFLENKKLKNQNKIFESANTKVIDDKMNLMREIEKLKVQLRMNASNKSVTRATRKNSQKEIKKLEEVKNTEQQQQKEQEKSQQKQGEQLQTQQQKEQEKSQQKQEEQLQIKQQKEQEQSQTQQKQEQQEKKKSQEQQLKPQQKQLNNQQNQKQKPQIVLDKFDDIYQQDEYDDLYYDEEEEEDFEDEDEEVQTNNNESVPVKRTYSNAPQFHNSAWNKATASIQNQQMQDIPLQLKKSKSPRREQQQEEKGELSVKNAKGLSNTIKFLQEVNTSIRPLSNGKSSKKPKITLKPSHETNQPKSRPLNLPISSWYNLNGMIPYDDSEDYRQLPNELRRTHKRTIQYAPHVKQTEEEDNYEVENDQFYKSPRSRIPKQSNDDYFERQQKRQFKTESPYGYEDEDSDLLKYLFNNDSEELQYDLNKEQQYDLNEEQQYDLNEEQQIQEQIQEQIQDQIQDQIKLNDEKIENQQQPNTASKTKKIKKQRQFNTKPKNEDDLFVDSYTYNMLALRTAQELANTISLLEKAHNNIIQQSVSPEALISANISQQPPKSLRSSHKKKSSKSIIKPPQPKENNNDNQSTNLINNNNEERLFSLNKSPWNKFTEGLSEQNQTEIESTPKEEFKSPRSLNQSKTNDQKSSSSNETKEKEKEEVSTQKSSDKSNNIASDLDNKKSSELSLSKSPRASANGWTNISRDLEPYKDETVSKPPKKTIENKEKEKEEVSTQKSSDKYNNIASDSNNKKSSELNSLKSPQPSANKWTYIPRDIEPYKDETVSKPPKKTIETQEKEKEAPKQESSNKWNAIAADLDNRKSAELRSLTSQKQSDEKQNLNEVEQTLGNKNDLTQNKINKDTIELENKLHKDDIQLKKEESFPLNKIASPWNVVSYDLNNQTPYDDNKDFRRTPAELRRSHKPQQSKSQQSNQTKSNDNEKDQSNKQQKTTIKRIRNNSPKETTSNELRPSNSKPKSKSPQTSTKGWTNYKDDSVYDDKKDYKSYQTNYSSLSFLNDDQIKKVDQIPLKPKLSGAWSVISDDLNNQAPYDDNKDFRKTPAQLRRSHEQKQSKSQQSNQTKSNDNEKDQSNKQKSTSNEIRPTNSNSKSKSRSPRSQWTNINLDQDDN